MSTASKRARAERRRFETTDPTTEPTVLAVALVRDSGAYRRIVLRLPQSVLEAHAVEVTEPEFLAITLAGAIEALEAEVSR